MKSVKKESVDDEFSSHTTKYDQLLGNMRSVKGENFEEISLFSLKNKDNLMKSSDDNKVNVLGENNQNKEIKLKLIEIISKKI